MKSVALLAISVGCCAALVHADAPDVAAADAALVTRFLNSDVPRLATYRARRTLAASTSGGRMQAEVQAWTSVDRDGKFRYEVVSESGSALIREHVLLKALETEQRTVNERVASAVELTPENYEFSPDPAGRGPRMRIAMRARRSSPMLLNGFMTVTREDGDLLSVDGSLAAMPSWWTRRVDIARRYARINGVRVPVEMSSRADVRVVGESTFRMTFAYQMINGQPAHFP